MLKRSCRERSPWVLGRVSLFIIPSLMTISLSLSVIEDDGLENRKTAYETMYTLVSQSRCLTVKQGGGN